MMPTGRNSHKLLAQLINSTSDLIFVKDKELRMILCNQALASILGKTPEEMYGHTDIENNWPNELIYGNPEKGIKGTLNDDKAVLQGNTIRNSSEQAYVDGKVMIFDVLKMPLLGDHGEILGVIGIARNVTESRRAEEASLRSKELLRMSIHEMLEGYALHEAIFDEHGTMIDYRFLEFNPAAQRISSIKREDIVGKTALELYPNISKRGLLQRYALVMATGIPEHITDFYYEGDRLDKAFDISCFRVDQKHFVCVFRDVTERKLAEKVIAEKTLFIESLVNLSPDVLYIYDLISKENVYINKGIQRVLGYSIEEMKQMGDSLLKNLMHPDDFKEYLCHILPRYAAAKDQELISNQYRMKHRDQTWRYLESREIIYNRNPDGSPRQIFGVISDITQHKKAEVTLKEAKEQAEAANKAKTEFLLNISHDIRTPLNSILGFSSLISSVSMDEKSKKCVQIIKEQGKGLLSLVEDILQVSKLESGQVTLKSDVFNLTEILKIALDSAQIGLGEKKVALSCHVPQSIPPLKGDALRTGQILNNILGNAVKYTDQGRIDVTVTGNPEGENRYFVQISVKDTGFGIAPEHLPWIFDPFTRFHEFYNGVPYEGIGLGLNISKTLLKLMGGDIRVESKVGEGSEFIITFHFELANLM